MNKIKKNNIFIPILIILFSILIIVGLFQLRKKQKIDRIFESFTSKIRQPLLNNVKQTELTTNTQFSAKYMTGYWTKPDTSLDSKDKPKNLCYIDVENNKITNSYKGLDYKIISFTNLHIVAVPIHKHHNLTLSIDATNVYTNPTENSMNSKINIPFCIFSISRNDKVIVPPYYSYRVPSGKIRHQLKNIITSKNYKVIESQPLINMSAYNTILNNYKYANNLIRTVMDTPISNNQKIYNKLNKQYNGIVSFKIQRTFHSPMGGEFTSPFSRRIDLDAYNKTNIITKLVISPVDDDFKASNIKGKYQPKSTTIYFYKIINTNISYSYTNNSIATNKDPFELKNGGDSMYYNNIHFPDLNSVQKKNTSTFNIIKFKTIYNNKSSDSISVPFSDLHHLL
jgi:hypothetical protein